MTVVPPDPHAEPPPSSTSATRGSGPNRFWARTLVRTLVGLLVFIGLPVAEITLLIVLGQHIGVLPTLGILLLEAAVGTWLAVRAGSRAFRTLSDGVSAGRLPPGRMSDAALLGVGGILLIVPGLITDVVALAFIVPVTRPLLRRLFAAIFSRQVEKAVGVRPDVLRARLDRDNTIDGQVADPIPGEVVDPDDQAGEEKR